MMASVGATSRQIRSNVLFEGAILGCIGIPLGIGLGYAVTGGLIVLLNYLLEEVLSGFDIQFSTSIWTVIIAIGMSTVTIFLSSIFVAIRASKISPVSAIRSNQDVKLSRKENKRLKTPKYISKLLGIGGEIAYKSLKRSRKKYRTTVISIVVSVMLFIAMSSFMEYTFGALLKDIDKARTEYNVCVNTEMDYEDIKKIYDKILALGTTQNNFIQYHEYVEFRPEQQLIESKGEGAREEANLTVLGLIGNYLIYYGFYKMESGPEMELKFVFPYFATTRGEREASV